MLDKNIKTLRIKKGLTQKELAEMLHVTAQAVSRWETGAVEPSVDTLSSMAKIFGVTTDQLIGREKEDAEENSQENVSQQTSIDKDINNVENNNLYNINSINEQSGNEQSGDKNELDDTNTATAPQTTEKEKIVYIEPRPVLGICERCKEPIYEKDKIVSVGHGRNGSGIICKSCDEKAKKKIREQNIKYSKKQRIWSFVIGGLVVAISLVIAIVNAVTKKAPVGDFFITISLGIGIMTFISCMMFNNNFVSEMFFGICSWGFVKFPGIIFSFNLDGFIFLITIKILFFLAGIFLAVLAACLALAVSIIFSLFVYPFALYKNIKHPEKLN